MPTGAPALCRTGPRTSFRPLWSLGSCGLPGAQAQLSPDRQRELDLVSSCRWKRPQRPVPPWYVTWKTVTVFALCPEQMAPGQAGCNRPWDDPGAEDWGTGDSLGQCPWALLMSGLRVRHTWEVTGHLSRAAGLRPLPAPLREPDCV